MSLYARFLLPRLIDLGMRTREVAAYRLSLVPRARGAVVEIGIGSGLNLPYYGRNVERVYAVDPSEELLHIARKKARDIDVPVKFIPCPAETLPLQSGCADTVVTTFTLCSVTDALQTLREAKRVLKPQGVLIFAEHGLAPDASVQRWQHRLNPLWRRIAGGCNLDRPIDAFISAAGFQITALDKRYMTAAKPMTYVYAGEAARD
jgi:ubiquinone/menaquinone biosynthesis C-methylase UbiE